jgi:hypothetical protein
MVRLHYPIRIRLNKSYYNQGGQLAGILQFLRGSASRNFFSSENSWGGQLAGIPEILPGVSLLE